MLQPITAQYDALKEQQQGLKADQKEMKAELKAEQREQLDALRAMLGNKLDRVIVLADKVHELGGVSRRVDADLSILLKKQ